MGGGGVHGLSQWVQLCTWSPNKLWRSNSIFNLWHKPTSYLSFLTRRQPDRSKVETITAFREKKIHFRYQQNCLRIARNFVWASRKLKKCRIKKNRIEQNFEKWNRPVFTEDIFRTGNFLRNELLLKSENHIFEPALLYVRLVCSYREWNRIQRPNVYRRGVAGQGQRTAPRRGGFQVLHPSGAILSPLRTGWKMFAGCQVMPVIPLTGPPSSVCSMQYNLFFVKVRHVWVQCCGSGTGSAFILIGWIRIRIGNTDPDPGGQKWLTKILVFKC